MRRLWNRIFVLLCAFICASCGFLDLRPIGINIEPDKNGSVLSGPHTPVILKFDTEMKKSEAEGILQISSDSGIVRGDRFWKGRELYFVPVSGWTAGVRYTLSLAGLIRSTDGRELRLEKFISFYAINKNGPPLLLSHSPADGASTGTEGIELEFHFSRSMERPSVESSLSVDGAGNKTFEWSANDTIFKVIPEKTLSPWITCRWTLKESAKSADGVPLPKTFSGQFTTDMDHVLPRVLNVFPVLNTDGIWYPTGAEIESGLEAGQGIAVEFNKVMDESVLRSVRLEPSLSGRTEKLSEKSIVYIFTKDPEPETAYTLIISPDAKDRTGIKLGEEYRINFMPNIPYLKILSFKVDDDSVIYDFSSQNNILKVTPSPATGVLYFTIHFSLPLADEDMKITALKISLNHFFPKDLLPVTLNSVQWISNDRLRMGWEGLKAGGGAAEASGAANASGAENDGENHFYKLVIPGSKSGISGGSGIYMKDDITIFLEAIK